MRIENGKQQNVMLNLFQHLSGSGSSCCISAGQKGFTLAEILIALTVIGVISAVTVPVLMHNTQKREFVSGLKKTYSTLSQVTNQIIAEEGSPKGDDGWALSNDTVYNMYKKHLNVLKDCGSAGGCFGVPEERYTFLNKTGKEGSNWQSSNYRRLVLSDGVQLLFWKADKTCPGKWHGNENPCAVIYADLNGEKKPNIYGRDVFMFILKDDGLHPSGCDTNSQYCTNSSNGVDCACKVLREAAMNY